MSIFTGLTDFLGLTDTEAAERAIAAQTASAQQAIGLQSKMYEEAKQRFAPYSEQGLASFQDLAKMAQGYEGFQQVESPLRQSTGQFTMADFQADPGYQFRMTEGVKALDRSAASKGRLQSGASLKQIQRFGQGLASEEYGNAYNRYAQDYARAANQYRQQQMDKASLLGQIANYGQQGNLALAGQGASTAASMGNTLTSLGSAQAAAEMARGNEMKNLWQMGLMGKAVFCWVARAIFGSDNPKWLEARHYIKYMSPVWFRKLYKKYGPSFAKKVEKSTLLKIILRPLFEYFAFRGRASQKFLGELLWQ